MINKIFALCDMEFKRIYKVYFLGILTLIGMNIILFVNRVSNWINLISSNLNLKPSIKVLKNRFAINYTYIFDEMIEITIIILVFFVLISLIYGIIIWYKDFSSKNKIAFILYLLPQNRMNIFFSKLIIVVSLIYNFILIQMGCWFLEINIINELLGKDIYNFFDIQSLQPFVLSNSRDFFMIDTLGVVCAVFVIFMCTIISMVYKKIALIVYPAVIYFSMFFYFLGFYEIKDDMNIFLVHIVYFIFLIILSLTVSSKLLKDKINF